MMRHLFPNQVNPNQYIYFQKKCSKCFAVSLLYFRSNSSFLSSNGYECYDFLLLCFFYRSQLTHISWCKHPNTLELLRANFRVFQVRAPVEGIIKWLMFTFFSVFYDFPLTLAAEIN